jgi:hypothetical protein
MSYYILRYAVLTSHFWSLIMHSHTLSYTLWLFLYGSVAGPLLQHGGELLAAHAAGEDVVPRCVAQLHRIRYEVRALSFSLVTLFELGCCVANHFPLGCYDAMLLCCCVSAHHSPAEWRPARAKHVSARCRNVSGCDRRNTGNDETATCFPTIVYLSTALPPIFFCT